MKRALLLTVTAVAALFVTSCQKEDLGRILTATIEQYEHSGNAKAYINNDYYACWENNDKVNINGVDYPISISEGEHNYTASIQGTDDLVGTLLAFYPASQVSDLTASGGTVTLPHIQNYETTTVNGVTYQKINNPMAAYCPEGSDDLKFHNLCALLKVTVQGNTYVKAIQVKGIDNQMLWGTAPLKLNSQRRPVLGEFAKGSNSVVLNFAAPTEVSGSKSFYIVVPGGTLFTNITIAVLTTDATGTTYTSYCKTGFLGESLSRNNIGAINYTFLGDQDDSFTPDWMIRYTGTAQVTPYNTPAFGNANYLSANSSFSNNSGYLFFDGPLTTIGTNAFKDCRALTTISLPASVTTIGANAFYNCWSLTSISLPATLISIGVSAFYNCSALTGIDLSHTEVTSIGDNAFEDCSAFKSISLPATLNSLGNNAFQDCSALTGIDLSHTEVTLIEDNAFEDCSALTTISLPATLTRIGNNAFEDCSSLKSISLPATLTRIGTNAFKGCSALTSIDLSHTRVTSIGPYAFNNCESLTTISLPANLLSIGGSAFQGCTSLSSINLPANLQSIGTSAFEGCDHLTNIALANTGVTSIEVDAFNSCTALTTISLPANLQSIGRSAFQGCTSLEYVDCYAPNPPTLGPNAFDNIAENAFLFVPSSSVQTYTSNSNWNEFFPNRIGPLRF